MLGCRKLGGWKQTLCQNAAGLGLRALFAAIEKADTRGWVTLPAQIRLARVPLSAGTHRVTVNFKDRSGQIVKTASFNDVVIRPGKRTFITYRTDEVSGQESSPMVAGERPVPSDTGERLHSADNPWAQPPAAVAPATEIAPSPAAAPAERLNFAGVTIVPACHQEDEPRQAIAATPGDAEAHLGLAQALMQCQEWTEAALEFQSAANLVPKDDDLRLLITERLGKIALRQNRLPEAKGLFLRAIKFANLHNLVDTNLTNAYLGLAYCLDAQNDSQNAIKNLKKAYSLVQDEDIRRQIRARLQALNDQTRQ